MGELVPLQRYMEGRKEGRKEEFLFPADTDGENTQVYLEFLVTGNSSKVLNFRVF